MALACNQLDTKPVGKHFSVVGADLAGDGYVCMVNGCYQEVTFVHEVGEEEAKVCGRTKSLCLGQDLTASTFLPGY